MFYPIEPSPNADHGKAMQKIINCQVYFIHITTQQIVLAIVYSTEPSSM